MKEMPPITDVEALIKWVMYLAHTPHSELFPNREPEIDAGPFTDFCFNWNQRLCGDKTFYHIRHNRMQLFWENVDIQQKDECWNWKSTKTPTGYGMFSAGKIKGGTHRIAYEFVNGPIPKGLFICHKCNNPSCCNPNHLYAGTAKDNSTDMVRRLKSGDLVRRNKKSPSILSIKLQESK